MESKASALAKQFQSFSFGEAVQSLLLWRFKTPSLRRIGWSPNL